jgi:hypothetical protein
MHHASLRTLPFELFFPISFYNINTILVEIFVVWYRKMRQF